MDSTNYRIGNVVRHKINKTIVKITALNDSNEIATSTSVYSPPYYWEGIEITHDNFDRCGAEDTDDWEARRIKITDYLFIERNAMGGTYLVDKNGMSIAEAPLKYIHQLQNLFFSLKGTEIEIKGGWEKI